MNTTASAEAQRLPNKNEARLRTVLSLWKVGPPKDSSPESAARTQDVPTTAMAKVAKDLPLIRSQLENLASRTAVAETRQTRLERTVAELAEQLSVQTRDIEQSKNEEGAKQRQLERLAETLDQHRMAVAEQKAQLQYLTEQSRSWRGTSLPPAAQVTYWALAGWVYVPLLHLIQGLWVVVFPVVETMRSITLFGSVERDPRHDNSSPSATPRRSIEALDARRGSSGVSGGMFIGSADRRVGATATPLAEQQQSLLSILQSGTLDPTFVPLDAPARL